jgi:hypothetical protein
MILRVPRCALCCAASWAEWQSFVISCDLLRGWKVSERAEAISDLEGVVFAAGQGAVLS